METSSRRTLRGPRGSSQANSWSSLRAVPGRARHCSCTTAAPSLLRPVIEDVAEMRVAARAAYLGADHPVRAVFNELYGLRRDGLGEARPPGARVVLRPAVKEQVAAGGAVVEPVLVGEGQLVAVGTDAEANRAAHARPAQTAVSIGDLVEVLLMVGLGIIERASGRELCGDRTVTGMPKRLLVGFAGLLGGLALLVVGVVDRRAVLRSLVVALSHPLRRVVGLPEHPQQVPVGDLLAVEDDEHGLGVSGSAAANLLVRRVWGKASRVADRRRVNAIDLPEFTLGPPEAAEAEYSGARALGEGRLEGCAEHGVPLGNGECRLLPAGKGLVGHGHLGLVATKEHSLTSSDVLM